MLAVYDLFLQTLIIQYNEQHGICREVKFYIGATHSTHKCIFLGNVAFQQYKIY